MAAKTSPKKTANTQARRVKGRSGNPAKVVDVTTGHYGPLTARDWIAGARLRTLPLAIAPVALGTGAGWGMLQPRGPFHPWWALAALIVAIALQIGVNFANDYSDGIRGTDAFRVGPARLTASGRVNPKRVLMVALVFFALAALAGLYIVIRSGEWWLLAVGAISIVAAWFYTGGKRPYGYYGLGEIAVFVFFGLVATIGSTWVQAHRFNVESWLSAIGMGLLACAAIMANNLRDRSLDAKVRKRTLAVLLPERAGRALFCIFAIAPFVIVAFWVIPYPTAMFAFFGLLAALPACLMVTMGKNARDFILALQLIALAALVYGVALGLAFWL